jgi:hypothetical protein
VVRANCGKHFYVFLYANTRGPGRQRQSHAQVSWIEARFFDPDRRLVAGDQGAMGS